MWQAVKRGTHHGGMSCQPLERPAKGENKGASVDENVGAYTCSNILVLSLAFLEL